MMMTEATPEWCGNSAPHDAHAYATPRSAVMQSCIGIPDDPKKCRNVGELTVGGKVVGLIRCDLDAGHEERREVRVNAIGTTMEDSTPHRATLEWEIEGQGVNLIDWPEANDPDEHFDVIVPITAEPETRPCVVCLRIDEHGPHPWYVGGSDRAPSIACQCPGRTT